MPTTTDGVLQEAARELLEVLKTEPQLGEDTRRAMARLDNVLLSEEVAFISEDDEG